MAVDASDLERFVSAQESTYSQALAEVQCGAKRSHWMWFVFPQLASLGRSEMARRYAISGLDEVRSYLAHPVLGARYREIVTALQDLETSDAEAVFGAVDAQKLRSSLTLFVMAGGEELFIAALKRWCGTADPATVNLLQKSE